MLKKIIQSIPGREWKFVAIVAAALVAITAFPYLYGYFTAPLDMAFTGIHHLTPVDTNTYLSMIEQAKQGENVFRNLYTSEPQQQLLINPLWLSVGWLARAFNLPNLLALHLARSFWVAAFIFVLYLFLGYFFRSASRRKIILIVVLFASGLGVFFNPFLYNPQNIYEHPTDVWVPESVTFLTLYNFPHTAASLTLLVLIFLLMLFSFESDKLRYSVGAGVATLFLLWFHPFNGPTVYAVLGAYLLLKFAWQRSISWSNIRHYLVLCLAPIPVVAYLVTLSRVDPVTREWAAQNICLSPSVWMYLIGYGLLLVGAIVGVWITIRQLNKKSIFLVIWAITSSLLLYIPLNFQRRLSEGLHVPLAILAAVGFFYLYEKLKRKDQKSGTALGATALVISLAIFLPLTNLQIIGQDFHLFSSRKDQPYYIYRSEIEAMVWLREHASPDEVVFSSYLSGNFIPAYSGRLVWIGHSPQTVNLAAKKEQSAWFWGDDREADRKQDFLEDNGIDHLYYGRNEKALGTFDPGSKDFLREEFRNDRAVIYRVL